MQKKKKKKKKEKKRNINLISEFNYLQHNELRLRHQQRNKEI